MLQISSEHKKILFIHNAIPEYRVQFWRELSNYCDLTIAVTSNINEDKTYGLDKNTAGLNIVEWNIMLLRHATYQAVILPPADNYKQFSVAVKVAWYCENQKIPYIYWSEKWEAPLYKTPIKKRIKNHIQLLCLKLLLHKAAICIASGTQSKCYLENRGGVFLEKLKVATDSSTSPENDYQIDFYEKYGIPDHAKVILYLGRIVERKGLLLLIKAFQDIKMENIYLLICGEGEFKQFCINYVQINQILNVVFVGKVQPQFRRVYYKRADLFVLPSLILNGTIEAWGLVVNEALECGTPVIATTAVGAAYDLLQEGSGIMIQEGSVIELKTAILNILNSKNKDFTKEICATIAEKYSVYNMAKAFYEAICDATERNLV